MKLNFYSCSLFLGIEIFGLEHPLVVGESATISCMTNIPVFSIEWRDQLSRVLQNVTDDTWLNYTISVVSDDMQVLQFTCIAEAQDGTVYSQTVEIQVIGKH